MDLIGSLLWRVVYPRNRPLHARLLWERSKRAGARELRLVDALVGAGDVAVDIGANFGMFAHRLARRVGREGRVYAFEPHPVHRVLLQESADTGSFIFFPIALSDQPGTAELRVPRRRGRMEFALATLEGGPAPRDDDFEVERLEVPLDTLDRVLAGELRRVSFIKCDVEGHELAVLRGGAQRLARDHPTLLVEIEQRHQARNIGETFDLLDRADYQGWVVRPDGLAPCEAFDSERDQSMILRALAPGADPGEDYLNTFLFTPRGRALPPIVAEMVSPS